MKFPSRLPVVLILSACLGLGGWAIETVGAMSQDVNAWLSYSIVPQQLQTALRPAMWGNGQVEVMGELDRPCISEAVCFGFGSEGLWYGPGGEEHLLPAVYDARTGKKYFLYSTASSQAQHSRVTFRPDRQIWHYEFDDLSIDVSLVLPRLRPGYLVKLELFPAAHNRSRRWYVYHELRAFRGNRLWAREAEYDLRGGRVWFKSSRREHGEAIGSMSDAEGVNLGLDGGFATDILVKVVVERDDGARPVTVYFARAFGDTVQRAKESLAQLLSSPEKLEAEAEEWWNEYLKAVPCLDTPDESFSKNFLWSWANFRMNRIDLPAGKVPAGLCPSNNVSLKTWIGIGDDHLLEEAIQLLHDPQPARELMLYWLRETRKSGLFSPGPARDTSIGRPGNYVNTLAYFCGLLHKYLLSTGDLGLLNEDIGEKTVLQRLEEATEVQLPLRDKQTGLYPIDEEITRFPEGAESGRPFGLGPMHEAVTRYRGGAGTFYSDTNASIYGGFVALAEIEELAQKGERSSRYRQLAEELRQAIQKYLWNDALGFFVDRRPDGSLTDYLGIGGFITGLFANPVHRPGGVATEAQAAKLAAWCNHPDFASELGVLSLARRSPYFDPMNYKGRNSGFNFFPTNQIPAGLYAHGCYEEAHRQLFKQFRRLGENAGLGPRYRGEAYHGDTGEILPWRFPNYPCNLPALSSVIEGVFGMRWTNKALTVHVNSPWPWAKLRNLRIRNSLLDLEWTAEGSLVAKINGKETARSADGRLELPWDLFSRHPI